MALTVLFSEVETTVGLSCATAAGREVAAYKAVSIKRTRESNVNSKPSLQYKTFQAALSLFWNVQRRRTPQSHPSLIIHFSKSW